MNEPKSERKKKIARRPAAGGAERGEERGNDRPRVTVGPARTRTRPSDRSGPVATDEEIALEDARCRKLQRAVDVTVALIHQSQGLSLGDMIEIVQHTRSIALELFPGSGETFDLLHRPRLIRAINERFGIEASPD